MFWHSFLNCAKAESSATGQPECVISAHGTGISIPFNIQRPVHRNNNLTVLNMCSIWFWAQWECPWERILLLLHCRGMLLLPTGMKELTFLTYSTDSGRAGAKHWARQPPERSWFWVSYWKLEFDCNLSSTIDSRVSAREREVFISAWIWDWLADSAAADNVTSRQYNRAPPD